MYVEPSWINGIVAVKVLVIALDGQIRDALETQLSARNRPFDSVGSEWFDPDEPVDVQRPPLTIPKDIAVVVNAISLECLEQQVDESLVDMVSLLSQACQQAAIPLIQLSNSQVFDGLDGGRHREDDDVVPASRIGALLCQMEEQVRANCKQHIILRTGPLFSAVGENLLTSLIAGFRKGKPLTLSSTGSSCPMHASDLARVISAIIDQLDCGAQPWATYHYCSSDPVSSYLFAETVLAVVSQYLPAGNSPLVLEPQDTADTRWPRPLLNCDRILNTFGIKQLPWRAFMIPVVKQIFEPDKEDPCDE